MAHSIVSLVEELAALYRARRTLKAELNKLYLSMCTVEAVVEEVEQTEISEDLEIYVKQLDVVLKNASDLLGEIELRSQGSACQMLYRFFSSSNPLVFFFRIGHRIKNARERIDEIAAGRDRVNLASKSKSEMLVRRRVQVPATSVVIKKIRERVPEIITRIDKVNDNVTCSFFPASEVIGLVEDRVKLIVYIVGACVDPFFLYIPFLSLTKMCLGMNKELWKVAVALRTVADSFTALILLTQLSRCMSSINSILLVFVKFVALAPIPQILFSEKFIWKTLGEYTFGNLSLFSQYGIKLVLIFQLCEQLKRRVSARTLVRLNAPVYLFLYLNISHVIGASWYYLSIRRLLSCWNYACKNVTGCIFPWDGTNTFTLNSTLVIEYCPPNTQQFGIFLDALQSGIVEDKGVLKKFLQCFFWGLRNLSSFASNLHTSSNDGETFFAIIISAVALILLIYVLGNIQNGFPSANSGNIQDGFPSANSATERVDSSNRTGKRFICLKN